MNSYWDCPECNGKHTMIAEKSTDIHICNKCNFKAGSSFLFGYWMGHDRAIKINKKNKNLKK
jgi:ribosomal protein L37AE/L43A